jgi:hypothetical protein
MFLKSFIRSSVAEMLLGYLRGLVERYEDKARILIRAGHGEEWMRFTAAKELCHIAIDEKEDWSPLGQRPFKAFYWKTT